MAATLITGATGFIGRRLMGRLLAEGVPLISLQRTAIPAPIGVEVIVVDDFEPDKIRAALMGRRLSTVFHLAAYGIAPNDRNPTLMTRVNVEATMAIANMAERGGARSVVLAGSSAEYRAPATAEPLGENAPLETQKLYGVSKAAASIGVLNFARERQLPVAVARLFNVYGPGEATHRLLPSLFAGFNESKRIALSPGEQQRDFVYVDDVVAAFLALRELLHREGTTASRAYNVATGVATSVRAFAEMAADEARADRVLLGFGDIAMRSDEVPVLVGNSQLLQRRAIWKPYHDVQSGIRASLAEFVREQYPC